MKRFSVGRLSTLLILAVLYLATVNLAPNLPATRALLNGLHPDHFAVTWERAWSLYPLRVVLSGLAADGQTPTEQWQLDAHRAAVFPAAAVAAMVSDAESDRPRRTMAPHRPRSGGDRSETPRSRVAAPSG